MSVVSIAFGLIALAIVLMATGIYLRRGTGLPWGRVVAEEVGANAVIVGGPGWEAMLC